MGPYTRPYYMHIVLLYMALLYVHSAQYTGPYARPYYMHIVLLYRAVLYGQGVQKRALYGALYARFYSPQIEHSGRGFPAALFPVASVMARRAEGFKAVPV